MTQWYRRDKKVAAATMGGEGTRVLVNRLSRLLGERRLSVRQVAADTRLSYRGLLDLYHDRTRGIEFETLGRLCNYLRVPPTALLEWVPPEREEAARAEGALPVGSGAPTPAAAGGER
jgi:putative transcriptional regulator